MNEKLRVAPDRHAAIHPDLGRATAAFERPLLGWLVASAIISLALIGPVHATTGPPSEPPAPARPPSEFDFTPELDRGPLGDGRQAYRERRDPRRARDAYRILKDHLTDHPDDPVSAWHFSLSCYFMGYRILQDGEERKAVFLEGWKAADAALEVDPACAPCHLLSAINHGLWGQEVGIFRTLVGLPAVRGHITRATELDPHFGGGAPYRIQATLDLALPRLLGGGKKKARRSIEKAIAVAPYEPLNYEFLAELLLKKYDDPQGALAVARTGLTIPPPDDTYLESIEALEWLQRVEDAFGKRYAPTPDSDG